MDLAALPAYLKGLQKAAGDAMVPAANAMGSTVKDRIQNVTLKQTAHAPGMFYKAAAGRPPAYASGNLSRSIMMVPASTSIRATAMVGATAVYAALQEFGGRTWPSRYRFMHWVNTGGPWWKKEVYVPEHPYFRPTVEELIRNGDLTREAQSAFWTRVQPYFNG